MRAEAGDWGRLRFVHRLLSEEMRDFAAIVSRDDPGVKQKKARTGQTPQSVLAAD